MTLAGDVVNVGGSLTGGRYKTQDSSFSSLRELERVKSEINVLEKTLNERRKSLNELENELREIAHFLLQKNVSFAKLEMEMTTKKGELQVHKSDYETLTNQSLEISQLESGETSNQLIEELNKAQKLKDELTEGIQAKRQLRMTFVNENEKIENNLREQRKASRLMQEEMTQKSIDKAKAETEIENVKKALEGSDTEAIKQATEKLTTVFYSISEKLYSANAEAANAGAEQAGGPNVDENGNVYDADYKVESDDNK